MSIRSRCNSIIVFCSMERHSIGSGTVRTRYYPSSKVDSYCIGRLFASSLLWPAEPISPTGYFQTISLLTAGRYSTSHVHPQSIQRIRLNGPMSVTCQRVPSVTFLLLHLGHLLSLVRDISTEVTPPLQTSASNPVALVFSPCWFPNFCFVG